MDTSESASVIDVKTKNHSGSCHQSGSFSGSKLDTTLAKTRHGRAKSIASRERTLKMFSGIMPRCVIQNPMTPRPSSTSTDCSTIKNKSTLLFRVYYLIGRLNGEFRSLLTLNLSLSRVPKAGLEPARELPLNGF